MCEGVNTSPCPLVYEVAAPPVPGPSIQYLNWAGITASREEVLAALLLVDTFGSRLHTPSCRTRNERFVIVCFTLPKSSLLGWHEKTEIHRKWNPPGRIVIFIRSVFNCADEFFPCLYKVCVLSRLLKADYSQAEYKHAVYCKTAFVAVIKDVYQHIWIWSQYVCVCVHKRK